MFDTILIMVYGRLLTYFYALLLVFSQQQVLLHPYQHKSDWQQVGYQQLVLGHNLYVQNALANDYENNLDNFVAQDLYDNKQAPGHGANCTKCIALSGISSVITCHTFAIHFLPIQTQHHIAVEQSFTVAVNLPYQTRAPPAFA